MKLLLFWRNLSIFWKTYTLSLMLSVSVTVIGEGAEDIVVALLRRSHLILNSRISENLLWVTAILFSSLLGSLIISRIITGTLLRIQPAVERLAKGELDSRIKDIDTQRGDELGSLSRSFNGMADSFERSLNSERTLIRDLSHEMRSPLARMKISLALLKRDYGWEENPGSLVRQLEKDLDRMELMVGQMLERARLDAVERSGFEQSDFDLAQMASESVQDHLQIAKSEKKTVLLAGLNTAPYRGNAHLLKRALDNMVKNALHYTPPDSSVTVSLRSVPRAVILEVIDQGPGVPPERLSDIFRPFYRVDPARSRSSGGFGLGLAIARQAVQLHGGQISAVNILAGKTDPGGPDPVIGLKVALTLPDLEP
ncbi:MAG: HAMP domain-containing histidine kinase [Deltaproteobacteria bacterium]|jgi:two-component system sensor histidine kinase CpxA|nr:HAMP domain-containing histidine kinase [Deltaproteobacteria bacterium]